MMDLVDEEGNVAVSMSDGETKVVSVYGDIFTTLINKLNAAADKVQSISCGEATIQITGGNVQATEVIAFVRAAFPDLQLSGQTTLKELDGKSFTMNVNIVDGMAWQYTFNFNLAQ